MKKVRVIELTNIYMVTADTLTTSAIGYPINENSFHGKLEKI